MYPRIAPRASPGHSALRRGRHRESGRIHLVTFTTRHRNTLFTDFEAGSVAAAALTDPRVWLSGKLLAWVLMPDHWHGLLQLGPLDSLDITIARLKSISAKRINRALRRDGAVWSRAFHDRALRDESDLLPAARYLVANPLRAGLVERIGDYPFWGAAWL